MKNNKGFTIIELMIVISMIAILVSIAAPSIAESLKRQRVESAGNELRGALQAGKMAALKKQADAIVRFTPGIGSLAKYSVIVDSVTVKQGTLPANVVLYSADFNGATSTQFNQMGLAYGFNGDVRISDSANQVFRRIVVTPVGNIRIEKSSNGKAGSWN